MLLAVLGHLVGGEWAGWACTWRAGALRRVPDRYLSDTALEWGQIPAGFEELTTESVKGTTLSSARVTRTWPPRRGARLMRARGLRAGRSVRLLPEDGCA